MFFEWFVDYFSMVLSGFLCTSTVVADGVVLVDDGFSVISMFHLLCCDTLKLI